jgi:hypothetical protein
MRLHHSSFRLYAGLLGVLFTAAFPTLDAQPVEPDRQLPRGPVTAGGAINVSQPRGVFDETTNLGWGISGNVLFRLDPRAILNFRADLAFQNYGSVNQRVPLSNTIGNLIKVDLNTTNNIVSFVTGPQLLGPSGTFTPYAAALGGFSAFWTSSSVEGSNNEVPFATTTNSSDFAWAYGGVAGAYLKVSGGERPVRLDAGVRYLRHDDVTYLTANEVRAAINESRDPRPIRSRVDFYTYFVGVQATIF